VIVAAIGAALCASFPLSHSLEDSSRGTAARLFATIGADWLGIVFLLFLTLLAADLATGFGFNLSKGGAHRALLRVSRWRRARSVRACAGGTCSGCAQLRCTAPESTAERDGTVLVVMSDLHWARYWMGTGWRPESNR